MHTRLMKVFFLCTLVLSVTHGLGALEFQNGYRLSAAGGFPSGKGLWDWTDTEEEGILHWGFAGSAGLVMLFNFDDESWRLETGLNIVHLRGRQSLGDKNYEYIQNSFEFPLLYKKRLPFPGRSFFLGGGPVLIFNPLEGKRIVNEGGSETESYSKPGNPVMLGLQIGADWKFVNNDIHDWMLSFHFIHPLTSPDYGFETVGSGGIRINRLELGLTYLYSPGRDTPRRRKE